MYLQYHLKNTIYLFVIFESPKELLYKIDQKVNVVPSLKAYILCKKIKPNICT